MANTLSFLLQIVRRLEAATLPVWVFGGWAEELWRISQPRMQNDIDFLYPAASFEQFDHFISQANDVHEIRLKRFSHKRAILCQHVMIEFLLVQHEQNVHFTNFFSGRYKLMWPEDLLGHRVISLGFNLHVASKQAVISYRQNHLHVEQAYHAFLQLGKE